MTHQPPWATADAVGPILVVGADDGFVSAITRKATAVIIAALYRRIEIIFLAQNTFCQCNEDLVLLDGIIDKQGSSRTKSIRSFGPQGLEDLGISHFQCEGAPALSGLSAQHMIVLNRSDFVGITCTIGKQRLDHVGMAGNVTLIPAGVEWTATAGGALDNIAVSIPQVSFAAAAARMDRPSLTIKAQIRGQDDLLQAIIDEMVVESALALDPGARWHDLTFELIDHLTQSYSDERQERSRGFLTPGEIGRINAHLTSRLENRIAIDELAEVVAQSASHFPRIFRRTVGLSPHQYVVRLRLRRARELIRAGVPLAEAALRSGFADQSHLNSWVRRSWGTTPGHWSASTRP